MADEPQYYYTAEESAHVPEAILLAMYDRQADGGHRLREIAGIEKHPKFVELHKAHDSFRENNRGLNAAKADLEAKLAAALARPTADPTELEQAKASLAAKTASEASQAAQTADLQAKLDAERTAREKAQFRLDIGFPALKLGLHPAALDFLIHAASSVFHYGADGRLVATNGTQTVDEWLSGQLRTAAFLFQPSRGGGARNDASHGPREQRTVVDRNDPLSFGEHLAEIAAGTAVVK